MNTQPSPDSSPKTISKTDFVLWRECRKNAWLRKHKPGVFYTKELSEFDKAAIDAGIEIEAVARQLFPGGILIEGRDVAAQERTRALVATRATILFQPVFEAEGYMAAADVLQYDPDTNSYDLFEIKSSTKLKDEHLLDVAFQVLLLRRAGLAIRKVFLIHLDSSYVRSGDLDIPRLFAHVDITKQVDEVAVVINQEMADARAYLLSDAEPPGPCECIYRGRSRHCSTFAYSNPQVPAYGVHDIARIGNSPKKLKEMVDAGVFELDKIPTHIQLSSSQQAQVEAYRNGQTQILKREIAAELATLKYPIHFIDYETFPSPLPQFNGYSPYHHIPFQFSLHVVDHPAAEPRHYEFLKTDAEDPSPSLVEALRRYIGPVGHIIVWNKTFESQVNLAIANRMPDVSDYMTALNGRLYDLKDIFSKQYYVHKDLLGKVSIKNVLPVLVPKFSYKTLDIQEGGTAAITWDKIVSGGLPAQEIERMRNALLEYCKMDSYAMFAIWRELNAISTG